MDRPPPARTKQYLCLACLVALGILVLAWDRVATVVVVYHLRTAAHAPHAHMDRIEGLFPFRFQVPLVDVPGAAHVTHLDVVYDGTYNPFRLMSQTGPLVHGSMDQVEVQVAGAHVHVPIDAYRVRREPGNVWHVGIDTHRWGHQATVDVRWGGGGGGGGGGPSFRQANVTLDDGAVQVALDPYRVRVLYRGTHVLLDASWKDADRTVTAAVLGDVAHVVATGVHLATPTTLAIDRITSTVFGGTETVLVTHGTAAWQRAKGPIVNVAVAGPGVPWGVHVDAGATRPSVDIRHGAATSRATWNEETADHVAVHWDPPLATPLGTVAHMDLDTAAGAGTVWFADGVDATGPAALRVGPDAAVRFGPITVAASDTAVTLAIDGGKFHRFACVTLRGSLLYADPTVVTLDTVAVTTATERLQGRGEYRLPERTLRFSFDVEIST